MIKKYLKNICLFFCLLLFTILFLFITNVPQFLSVWDEFPWLEVVNDAELLPSLLVFILGLSVFVITFILCAKTISKAVILLKDSKHKAFVEIDLSQKGCGTVVYGYNVPIATINAYYAADGEVVELLKKQGVTPILVRQKQLTFRSEILGDAINCIAALMLSLVTAFITGTESQNHSSLNVIVSMVVIGISVTTLFLRPVLAEKVQSKYDDGIRKYELQKIDQVLLDYNKKLDLKNIEHCGEKSRLLEIRKQQKELDMTKSGLKQKKIRGKISVLEAGNEISSQKRRNAPPKGALYEKYRPASWFYILIIVACAIIRFIPFSTGSADLDDAIRDFSVGAAASTWATLLLAELDCSQKNKALARKKEMVFAEYMSTISDLRFFVAGRCKKFSHEDDQFTFAEWLSKLSSIENYSKNPSPAVTMNRTYFHISCYVRNVKSTLVTLRQQYCILVESDIVETDDLRQHIAMQIILCDDICDILEMGDYKPEAIEMANENLVELEYAVREFFSNSLEERYSRVGKG